jgi:hypothetical protein
MIDKEYKRLIKELIIDILFNNWCTMARIESGGKS